MVFALGARQHFLDVVETADQGGAEIEAGRLESLSALLGNLQGIQTSAKNLVDQRLEAHSALPLLPFQSDGHVVVQGNGRSHILMLPI